MPLGGVKQKKGGLFTAQKTQAVMEVKTVTLDNEMCSDGTHKLGHCLRHHVDLLHVGRGAPFNLVAKHAAGFLEKKKIQAMVFDGTGGEATVMEKHGYVVYMVGVPNKEGGKKPILIRVDSKWAHTHYGQYSGGNQGNGDKMVKTYFAVVRRARRGYMYYTYFPASPFESMLKIRRIPQMLDLQRRAAGVLFFSSELAPPPHSLFLLF